MTAWEGYEFARLVGWEVVDDTGRYFQTVENVSSETQTNLFCRVHKNNIQLVSRTTTTVTAGRWHSIHMVFPVKVQYAEV